MHAIAYVSAASWNLREFSDWSTGFSRPDPEEFVELAFARWKAAAQTGPGASLLWSFWASCRTQLA